MVFHAIYGAFAGIWTRNSNGWRYPAKSSFIFCRFF